MDSNPIIQLLHAIFTLNGGFNWSYVTRYLFHPYIMQGVVVTIILAVVSQFLGVVLGLILYFMRRSRFGVFAWMARAYVLVVRGTPLLVQILFMSVFLQQIHVDRFLAS